jgi:hypothetical protein
MNRFESLISRAGDPVEVQEAAHREFPALFTKSPLNLWKPGNSIHTPGVRFLIGVAVWNYLDMRLLDALHEKFSVKLTAVCVDIFDIDECLRLECLEEYIPRIGKFHHTPILGIWENGKQISQASGWAAREKITKHFGIDHHSLITPPKTPS